MYVCMYVCMDGWMDGCMYVISKRIEYILICSIYTMRIYSYMHIHVYMCMYVNMTIFYVYTLLVIFVKCRPPGPCTQILFLSCMTI